MGKKKGNNGDEKKNNGGEGIHIRFLMVFWEVAKLIFGFLSSFFTFLGTIWEIGDYVPNKLRMSAKVDYVPNKLRMRAKVDLGKPRDKVEPKGKKKVELVPPLPKDNKKGGGGGGGGGGGQKGDGKPQKKADEKKTKDKEPPVTTEVIKLDPHCQCLGCIEKIEKIIKNTDGYHDMSIGEQNLITVKGTMNMKALADALKEKLKISVEIVPPKKQGGGNKKEKGGTREKKEKGGREGRKGKKDGGGVLPKK